nr:uncharacterized protein LOC129270148 [Lytechinus pictus]
MAGSLDKIHRNTRINIFFYLLIALWFYFTITVSANSVFAMNAPTSPAPSTTIPTRNFTSQPSFEPLTDGTEEPPELDTESIEEKEDDLTDPFWIHSPPDDIISQFLSYVAAIEENIDTCKKGTWAVTLPVSAVSYGPERYMDQALKTVSTANMLTRIWQSEKLEEIHDNEDFFFNVVLSNVENDPKIFAFGNCYDKNEFSNYTLFCPYAYRQNNGVVNVKDLSLSYPYLSNDSEWFYQARMKVSQVLKTRDKSLGKSK